MPIRTYDEHAHGVSWVMDEPLARASHAVVTDGRVWLVDPVDTGDAIDRAIALGTPAGVLQLLDRHGRDCAAVAARLGVPHLENPDTVPGSPWETLPMLRLPGWRETALWWPAERVLVVAEVIGTNAFYTTGRGLAGVHPMLRAFAPGRLRGYQPEHLLVGHGPGLHGPDATTGLEHAVSRSRRDIPRLLTQLPSMFKAGRK
jgi:hypothetical protein